VLPVDVSGVIISRLAIMIGLCKIVMENLPIMITHPFMTMASRLIAIGNLPIAIESPSITIEASEMMIERREIAIESQEIVIGGSETVNESFGTGLNRVV
jgi:hypothetical protein